MSMMCILLLSKWLQEGYTNKTLFDSSFEDILHRLRVMKGLEVMDWYYEAKYEKAVQDAGMKLIEDMKYFL